MDIRHLDPSITAYVLLKLVRLSNFKEQCLGDFFRTWNAYYRVLKDRGRENQSRSPWAPKVIECLKSPLFTGTESVCAEDAKDFERNMFSREVFLIQP